MVLAVSRLLGLALFSIALVVAAQFMFNGVYGDYIDVGLAWYVLDFFMAAAILVSIAVNGFHKWTLAESHVSDGVSGGRVETNILFFGALLAALWFFPNWFDYLQVYPGPEGEMRLIFWWFIDPLMILVSGVTGVRLCQKP